MPLRGSGSRRNATVEDWTAGASPTAPVKPGDRLIVLVAITCAIVAYVIYAAHLLIH